MRLPLWATLCTLISVAILCGLGVWQLQRLAYKEKLIGQIRAELTKDPMETELAPGVLLQAQMNGAFYVRGFVEGVYLHEHEILVGPRTREGEPGYHVYTPFESYMSDDTILVNRGWVPYGLPEARISRPNRSMIVTGTARKPAAPNSFTPENNPADDEWYYVDPAQISDAKNLKAVMPFILYADPQQGGEWPIPVSVGFNADHKHLQYALTWFSMALVLIVIYFLRFIRCP